MNQSSEEHSVQKLRKVTFAPISSGVGIRTRFSGLKVQRTKPSILRRHKCVFYSYEDTKLRRDSQPILGLDTQGAFKPMLYCSFIASVFLRFAPSNGTTRGLRGPDETRTRKPSACKAVALPNCATSPKIKLTLLISTRTIDFR